MNWPNAKRLLWCIGEIWLNTQGDCARYLLGAGQWAETSGVEFPTKAWTQFNWGAVRRLVALQPLIGRRPNDCA